MSQSGFNNTRGHVEKNPFFKSYDRLKTGQIEFGYFKSQAVPKIKSLTTAIPRFEPLEAMFSFYVDDETETLQLWFGKRSMFRKDGDKVASETGGTLLYSIGPTGDVAVSLYPMKSSLAKPLEDIIFLRIGSYSGNQLLDFLPRDIKDLVAYCYVTSLDAEPTIKEKARIWWLRRTHPMQIKGEFRAPMMLDYGGVAFKFTLQTMVMALLKPVAILVVIILLIYFGMPELAALIKPS